MQEMPLYNKDWSQPSQSYLSDYREILTTLKVTSALITSWEWVTNSQSITFIKKSLTLAVGIHKYVIIRPKFWANCSTNTCPQFHGHFQKEWEDWVTKKTSTQETYLNPIKFEWILLPCKPENHTLHKTPTLKTLELKKATSLQDFESRSIQAC
jgi:hypothetical protein